ncbi:MAG TPA: N-6 DNA methylase [Methylomirabilota bacterium]|nr:N-6 DNA methylase [Methylomirabilota bacterium]
MSILPIELRNKLERACIAARNLAERSAKDALQSLAVAHHEPYGHMKPEQRTLRNKLRARARQLGDMQDAKGQLVINHLAQECAYEHWHRMLFARFLAENNLLIEPDMGVAVSLEECKELAKDAETNLWALAGRYAQTMLPEIFRADDPVLQVPLAREDQLKLEQLLDSLTKDTFTASDSLGWCYQFWQAERKDEVNAAGNKIGADELPSVTQLFTEDYMVDFLLDNTLGAWWAGKRLAAEDAKNAEFESEEEVRRFCALPGCPWKYLRFIKSKDGKWTPAAGTFEGWPKTAKELKCIDPCMGSGHFVVAMFERLVAVRMAEEKLDEAAAVAGAISDNLFGLEIDPRCTQIGAFSLALAAWRRLGYRPLPAMNLACCGLEPNTREADWLKIAGDNHKLQSGMQRLYRLFQKAAVLGSLINPRAGEGDLLVAAFHELQPLLEKALAQETEDDTAHEVAVTARGLAKAAEILAGQFTLVATNVPYLGRGNQDDVLKDYCERIHPEAKNDLATCFLERCLDFCDRDGTASLVTPQNWFSQPRYEKLRTRLLTSNQWNAVARLGAGAFETIEGEVVTVSLVVLSNKLPPVDAIFMAADLSDKPTVETKSSALASNSSSTVSQASQLKNPDSIITLDSGGEKKLLNELARAWQGIVTGDDNRFYGVFWERPQLDEETWAPVQQAPQVSLPFTGRESVIRWEKAQGDLHLRSKAHNFPPPSTTGKIGIAIQRMVTLNATIFSGDVFDDSVAPLIPAKPSTLPAIYAFCLSAEFKDAVRRINHQPKVIPGALTKIPFDLAHWQKVAAEKYPHGLPKPFSSDPTQWLFNGHPKGSGQPLHVAVARLLGYQWPRQTGSRFPDCPALGSDGLEKLADDDGIVCLPSVRGEEPAAERLRKLLAVAFANDWKAQTELELIRATGSDAADLEEWLRSDFFGQHCDLFHQRPFLWHIWDGRKRDGFHALVNYHTLAGEKGKGRRLLESLTYAYLGEWITRQKDGVKRGEGGAEDRLAAALELQKRLEAILEGEPPFDLFVRWKPLAEQPIGWSPDINDGVRLNIRPFLASDLPAGKKGAGVLRYKPNIKWDKDRGKEPERPKAAYPWFWGWDDALDDEKSGEKPFAGGQKFDGNRHNDCHYTNKAKQAARDVAKKGGK